MAAPSRSSEMGMAGGQNSVPLLLEWPQEQVVAKGAMARLETDLETSAQGQGFS